MFKKQKMKWVSCKESCEHLPRTLPAMWHHSEMANLPLGVLEQFSPLSKSFPFRGVAAGLGSPAPLQIAPTRVPQASLPTEGPCGDGGSGSQGLPARGQGRASLLPWRALAQSSVSGGHLFFTECNRLPLTCLKVISVPLHLILLIRRESRGILL